tara:strand:- start:894 stop:1646 length:753 start_codon:yes stop_codon:yes gene_type:complete
MSGGSKSRSSSSNPTTTGYQYGGGQTSGGSGYQATAGENIKGSASGTGTNLGINANDISGDITVSNVSDDILRAGGQAIAAATAGGLRVADEANRRTVDATNNALHFADAVNDESQKTARQAAEASARASAAASGAAAESAARSAGMAIDSAGDSLKRALDFGDKSLQTVADSTGQSLDAVTAFAESALDKADRSYTGALKAVNANAGRTADAYARATGGQDQAAQNTVRQLAVVAGVAAVGIAIAMNIG